MPSQTFTSSGIFTVPAGFTSIMVECWGAGGGGGGSNPDPGGGGAGGAYAKSILTLPSGSSHNVFVGNGGFEGFYSAGGTGGDSSFVYSGGSVLAKGGGGGGLGEGGLRGVSGDPSAGSIGTTTFMGGGGRNGLYTFFAHFGGGGGGAAGSTGNGQGYGVSFVGASGTPLYGGNGGYGVSIENGWDSEPGYLYGGGGGAGVDYIQGKAGAKGLVIVSWGFSTGNSNFFSFF